MIPPPEVQPLISVDAFLAAMGDRWPMGRSATHEAARRGELPAVRIGRHRFLLTAGLWALLGLTPPSGGGSLAPPEEPPVRLVVAPDAS